MLLLAIIRLLRSRVAAMLQWGGLAVSGQEDRHLTDSLDALRTLIRDIKAGKADHLL